MLLLRGELLSFDDVALGNNYDLLTTVQISPISRFYLIILHLVLLYRVYVNI